MLEEHIADFSDLPREIVIKILEHLSYQEYIALTWVSRKWWQHATDPFLWRSFELLINEDKHPYLDRILEMRRFARIRKINCLHCQLRNNDVDQLSNFRSIDRLTIDGCDLTNVWPEVLANLVSSLEMLSIRLKVGTQLSTAQKIQMFTQMIENKRLIEIQLLLLDLSDVPDNIWFGAISKLKTVTLKQNNLTPTQKSNIFHAVEKGANITSISILKNDLSGVPNAIMAMCVSKLVKLEIVHCRMYPPQLKAIFDGLHEVNNLSELNLNYNCLNSIDTDIFIGVVGNIDSVNISGCQINIQQSIVLFKSLRIPSKLKNLDISQNNLSKIEPEDIAHGVNKLRRVNLSHANLNTIQIKRILKRALVESSVTHLNIKGNSMEQIQEELFKQTELTIKEFQYKSVNLKIYGHGPKW